MEDSGESGGCGEERERVGDSGEETIAIMCVCEQYITVYTCKQT